MSTELFLKNMEKVMEQTLKNHPENETMIKIFSPMVFCEERFILENPLKRLPVLQKNESSLFINVKNITLDTKKIAILKSELCVILKDVLPQFLPQIEILEKKLSNAKLKSMCSILFFKEKTCSEIINEYLELTLLPSVLKKKEDFAKCMVKNIEEFKKIMFSLCEILLTRIEHTFLNRYGRAIKRQKEKQFALKTKNKEQKEIHFQEEGKLAETISQVLLEYALESPTCPYCGARPSMSIVHSKEGKRDLLCPNCGQTWRYKRTICPNCLSEEQKNLQSVYKDTAVQLETKNGHIEKDKNLGVSSSGISERAIYCENCNHYLLELDLREKNSPFEHIPILALGLPYLDAIMQARGAKNF